MNTIPRFSNPRKQRFFHGSPDPLKPGTILKARQKDVTDSGDWPMGTPIEIEAFIESRRPANAVSRTRCIFFVTSPNPHDISDAGGEIDYIYEVFPIGTVTKGAFGWLRKVSIEYTTAIRKVRRKKFSDDCADLTLADQYARNYWSGKPLVETAMFGGINSAVERKLKPVFEYMALSVRIGKLIPHEEHFGK